MRGSGQQKRAQEGEEKLAKQTEMLQTTVEHFTIGFTPPMRSQSGHGASGRDGAEQCVAPKLWGGDAVGRGSVTGPEHPWSSTV